MEILARFNYDTLNHAQDNTPHLVVSLKAPALDWVEKRRPIAILPVIDLSGSMRGPKLKYAKQSVLKLIEHLAEGDFAGIVTFDDQAAVLVEPGEVTGDFKNKLRNAVQGLHIGGGTNLSDGMVKSIEIIQALDLPSRFLHRIILFTDGMPTMGVTDTKAILALLKNKRARATVSAFGYGEGGGSWGGVDQDFLTALSTEGEGNYAYVKDPDDALGAFGKELGGLLSTYATDLVVEIEPTGPHRVKKVVTNAKHEEDVTGLVEIPISNILGEETRHLVFECDLAKRKKAFPRPTTVFNVKVTYEVLTESGQKETRTTETKARVRFVREADAQAPKPHKEVDEIVALHQTIRAQLEAEEAAKQGNFAGAQQQMVDISQQIAARGHDNIAAAAQQSAFYVSSPVNYADNRGYLTSFANAGTRGAGTSSVDAEAAQVLTNCNVSLATPAMEDMGASFSLERNADLILEPGAALTITPANVPATSGGIIIPSSD